MHTQWQLKLARLLAGVRKALGCGSLLASAWLLSSCMGGPLIQQLATSMVSNALDQTVSDAYDAHLLKKANEVPSIQLKDTPPDPYWSMFVTSGFETAPPVENSISLPKAPLPSVAASRLVKVEVWNVLLGDEKLQVMQRALALGSSYVPEPRDWAKWQVATGSIGDANEKAGKPKSLLFLVPPDMGKLTSGEHAIIEIAESGGLHIARYSAE